MSLFTKLVSSVADFGAFVADDYRGHRILADVRREHDEWMRTAELRVPYYTVRPTVEHRRDMPHTRDLHAEYVFTRRGAFGLPNQLIADWGSPSWRLWLENGPFTREPKPTAESLRAADQLAEAANLRHMRERINAGVLAEIERLYPASLALHR